MADAEAKYAPYCAPLANGQNHCASQARTKDGGIVTATKEAMANEGSTHATDCTMAHRLGAVVRAHGKLG